jgi:hypothetical protein
MQQLGQRWEERGDHRDMSRCQIDERFVPFQVGGCALRTLQLMRMAQQLRLL